MNLTDCLNSRRSGRVYTDAAISKETLQELINIGVKAPTGSNYQPWGFVVIQDKAEIDRLSEIIKTELAANLDNFPGLRQYEKWFANPKFHVFNRAATLIVVYGDTNTPWYAYDCTMAAYNIMLAAWDMQIGTCWIGFAHHHFNLPEFKSKYNVPRHFELVCPMSMGYLQNTPAPCERKPAQIFNW